jgi:hypothetical protein
VRAVTGAEGARFGISSTSLLGTPGESGRLSENMLVVRMRCSGREPVLVKPSWFWDPARDLRCAEIFRESTIGDPGTEDVPATSPLISTSSSLFGRRRDAACGSPGAGRGLLLVVGLPVTVALRPNFCPAVAASAIASSIGRGLLACAIASGPAICGRSGRPKAPKTKLPRTVTGNTFSFILSLRSASPVPKTIL